MAANQAELHAARVDLRFGSAPVFALIFCLFSTLACDGDGAALTDGDSPPDGDTIPDGDTMPDGDGDGDRQTDGDFVTDGDREEGPPPEPILITDVAVVENPANVLSFYISWRTDLPAPTHLKVVCGDDLKHSFHDNGLKTVHELFLMGLYEGVVCELSIRAEADGRLGLATAVIDQVGPLPSILPEMSVSDYDPERVQPGWTFFSLTRVFIDAPDIVVGIDFEGRYRWYAYTGRVRRNGGHEIALRPEGLLIAGSEPQILMSWEGEILWDLQLEGNHDTIYSPWQEDRLLFIGKTATNCDTTEHTVNEFNLLSSELTWTWRICEHYTPRYQKAGWSHLNTIEPVPGEPAMLISSRDQDAIMRLNRATGQIDWVLGREGDFSMSRADYFLRQHAPEILPDGHILLFDNGLRSSEANSDDSEDWVRKYSRVIEMELSFDDAGEPLSAEVVWEYVDTDLFAVTRSEADRLDNGNTLIIYVDLPGQYVVLREVTHEKEVVWNATSPLDQSSYRAERIAATYGHIIR